MPDGWIQLSPDPSGQYHFLTTKGAQVSIFAESDSGTVHIVGATLNGTPQQVDANGKVTFTAVQGRNLLDLAFVGADPTEDFRVKEDCGGGKSQVLDTWRLQPTPTKPGGPTKMYRIYAS